MPPTPRPPPNLACSEPGPWQFSQANLPGWVMLMRSRMTLNQPAKAAKALKDAIAANPGSAQRLKAEAAVLNVPTV